MEQVGNLQQALRHVKQGRVLFAHNHELVERIEVHKLQTRLCKNLFARNNSERAFHSAVGAGVTVAIRIAKQFVTASEESEVHAPRVDSDARYLRTVFGTGDMKAVLNAFPETGQVPEKRPVHFDRTVLKAIELFQFDSFTVKMPHDVSTARRAHIDR